MCEIASNNINNKHLLNNIITNNETQQPPPQNNCKKIATHAIVDTGATAHYLNPQAPCYNKSELKNPTIVGLPNGNHLIGTKEAQLHLDLPLAARKATIFPHMTNMSLLSVGALCDANMTATFDKNSVKIYDSNNKCILKGQRDTNNGLWTLPLQNPTPQANIPKIANNVTKIKSMDNLIKYLHQALFSPTQATLINAIRKGQLQAWPGLSETNVKKYLCESDATIKGHLDQNRQNQMSTKKRNINAIIQESEDDILQTFTEPQQKTNEVLVTVEATNKIFTDQTGRFRMSSQGNQYVHIAYVYDVNAIIATPIKSRTGQELLATHKKIITMLQQRGYKPKFHWLDNEASSDLKTYNAEEKIKFQLTPPNIHRRNAAERAIRTWKNHFISGLCSTDPDFPIHLWDRLIEQANITLNLLRTCRIHPHLSAHTALHGEYHFDATPMAPPGCKSLILEHPTIRKSWGAHAVDAWYIGPALDHYRCYNFFIPSTRGYRISDTVKFQPKNCKIPFLSDTEYVLRSLDDIKQVLHHKQTDTSASFEAIEKLRNILIPITDIAQPQCQHGTTAPRVFNIPKSVPVAQPAKLPRVPKTKLPCKNQKQAPSTRVLRSSTRYPTRAKYVQAANFLVHQQLNAIICADTGKSMEYRHLIKDPALKNRWIHSFSNELGRLAQGRKSTNLPGTNTIFFTEYNNIPVDRRKDITYGRIVVDYRPQKSEPHRTRLTVGGNLINYPHSVSTKTAELQTAKLLFNSVISTRNAKFACLDIGNFYLGTEMDRFEYMFLPLALIPQEIIDQYELQSKVHNDKVYLEIRKGMYGLPQAGILANEQLQRNLKPHGYYPCKYTPGLWKHETRAITFSLVVDDFGIKYVHKEDVQHLYDTLNKYYPKLTIDWSGTLYCGITLEWDYKSRTVDLSMPNYMQNVLHKFQHPPPPKPQHSPYQARPIQYGAKIQFAPAPDTSEALDAESKTKIQQIVGALLYYARAIDMTMLPALSTLSSEQAKPTRKTMQKIQHLLDYCSTHPNAKIRYISSGMILKIHSDASYLSEPKARSRVGGHFYLGDPPASKSDNNGAVHTTSTILRNVVTSAAEAEYGGLFTNARIAIPMRITLRELGHPQPATPIITDNSTAAGIANESVKQKHSKAMDMRFHYIKDQVKQKNFTIEWRPGDVNNADYFTKHHLSPHHQKMRKKYLLEANTVLQGCVNKCIHKIRTILRTNNSTRKRPITSSSTYAGITTEYPMTSQNTNDVYRGTYVEGSTKQNKIV